MYCAPKEFLRSYVIMLAKACGREDIDNNTLLSAEKSKDGSLREMFNYIHDCCPESPWPTFCHDRSVFRKTFSSLHDSLGMRIKHIVFERRADEVSLNHTKSGQ